MKAKVNQKFDAIIALASFQSCKIKAQRVCAHPILSYLPNAHMSITNSMIRNRIAKFQIEYQQNPKGRYVRAMLQFVRNYNYENN